MRSYLVAFCFLFLFASCEKDANVDLPEVEPKMVVTCYISPGAEIVEARVSLTDPVFGPPQDYDSYMALVDAEVSIFSGNIEMPLVFDPNNLAFWAPTDAFEIMAGQTYRLQVSHPDYETLTASTTVPSAYPSIQAFEILDQDSLSSAFESSIRYRCQAKWTMSTGTANYFVLKHRRISTFNDGTFEYSNTEAMADLFVNNTDNTSEVEETWTAQVPFFDQSLPPQSTSHQLYVVNASEEYFRFHQSLENINIGNPFAEPAVVYSNITGGLGVFAGYTMITAEIFE